MLSVHWFRNFV